jgi:ferrous-iron efflux pump FieF
MNEMLSSATRERLMRRATYASVGAASLLILAKLGAWLSTDSISMLSTLVDSLLDAAASLVNLLAVCHALAPADAEHRFGHGKAEALASLVQSAFIGGSALFLMFAAGARLLSPVLPRHSNLGLMVMALSVAVTLVLVAYQRHVIRHTSSLAISADSLHYQGDIMINLGVAASLWLTSRLHWPWLDPLFGIGVALYLVYTVAGIGRQALDMLMDRELPEADRHHIAELARGHPEVVDVHDIRTRASGARAFIQLHLELDGAMSLRQAHRVADGVMNRIQGAFPQAEVLIHQDPAGIVERRDRFDGTAA